jgi:hypothetical protein
MVAKAREKLAVNKQRSHRFHMERFNLNKLNEVEGKDKYRIEVSNRFAGLVAVVNINIAWEMIRENINILAKESVSYYELKKYKPWFDEGCPELLDQRKQAKLQWLHDPSEINGENLNNIRHESTTYFRDKKREI